MENWRKFVTEVHAGDKADGEVENRDKKKNKKAKRELGLAEESIDNGDNEESEENTSENIIENWRNYVNEVIGQEGADALKDLADAGTASSDEMATAMDKQQAVADAQKDALDAATASSEKFKEFTDAMGAFSDSAGENAEQSDKMLELYQKFEEAGLEDFLDKVKDLEPLGDLMQDIDDGKSVGELIAGLGEIDMKPEEIGEKLAMVQELRDEFDEYKKEQEEKAAEAEKAAKNASRAGAEVSPDQAPA